MDAERLAGDGLGGVRLAALFGWSECAILLGFAWVRLIWVVDCRRRQKRCNFGANATKYIFCCVRRWVFHRFGQLIRQNHEDAVKRAQFHRRRTFLGLCWVFSGQPAIRCKMVVLCYLPGGVDGCQFTRRRAAGHEIGAKPRSSPISGNGDAWEQAISRNGWGQPGNAAGCRGVAFSHHAGARLFSDLFLCWVEGEPMGGGSRKRGRGSRGRAKIYATHPQNTRHITARQTARKPSSPCRACRYRWSGYAGSAVPGEARCAGVVLTAGTRSEEVQPVNGTGEKIMAAI